MVRYVTLVSSLGKYCKVGDLTKELGKGPLDCTFPDGQGVVHAGKEIQVQCGNQRLYAQCCSGSHWDVHHSGLDQEIQAPKNGNDYE